MDRLLNNRRILNILRKEYTEFSEVYDYMEEMIETFPRQRFGQIWCNYICPDYRETEPSEIAIKMLNTLFPNNKDPFFEESIETLNRLSKID